MYCLYLCFAYIFNVKVYNKTIKYINNLYKYVYIRYTQKIYWFIVAQFTKGNIWK